jgi:hypothetical protein
MSAALCKGLWQQTVSVVMQSTNAKVILYPRPHPPPEELAQTLLRRAGYCSYTGLSVETFIKLFLYGIFLLLLT